MEIIQQKTSTTAIETHTYRSEGKNTNFCGSLVSRNDFFLLFFFNLIQFNHLYYTIDKKQ